MGVEAVVRVVAKWFCAEFHNVRYFREENRGRLWGEEMGWTETDALIWLIET